MKDDALPCGDHVARFCKRKYITESGNVGPGAFMLKKDESYLSVQWIEILGKQNHQEEIDEVKEIFSRHLKIRPPAKIVVLNVGKTCDHVMRKSAYIIRVLHQPEQFDGAHSGIFDTNQDHEKIAELIKQTILEMHPAT